ncbi:DEAD/DEAH box helicase [Kitasatospora purpeofusca]|uniref:DEAD/DEAH box helicase n=1 Tax=Kitasatospora purpeofusca TaxID=67352 RepID=UPI002259B980|nr:DEAD/DEAH box helicase [Kitasatospora purpeofusca]MCX4752924.1 DEAD/DEAH box helicase [Kitasatospora purpeofusca]WSR32467.1 DEAD/DEAH box helicase [Kitasatospora purpeofusca]
MSFDLRPYQHEAITRLIDGWQAADSNRLAVVLPTGAGKTVVLSHLISRMYQQTGRRALVIAHREELIQQAAAKIRAIAPHLKVGVVKASRNEHRGVDVIVASIQTLAVRKRRAAITGVGLVVVDECHHAAASSYVEVLDHFGAWAGVPVAGFTATMTRTDGGLADVWQDIVFKLDILDLMADGHLVDVRGKRVRVGGLDLDKVKTRAGDLQDSQLGQALEDSGAARVVADAYAEHAADRPGVVFTPTVATAHGMADALTGVGIPAAAVWGDMPREDRAAALDRYKAGDLQVLTNCMVLTEGFDAPWASCAVIARPTKSPGLYVQMVGRVLRPSPGKSDALVLDVMGSSTRHKLASIVDLTGRDVAVLRENQSLAEAAAEPAGAEPTRPGVAFAVGWEDVDLFHHSRVRWLRTGGGLWFIPAGRAFYFLVPSAASVYRIRRWSDDGGIQPPTLDHDFTQADAMRWAEIGARSREGRALTLRDSAWRARPASPKQLAMCRYRRVRVGPGWTAGDVSDALDIAQATALLDPWVRLSAVAA